MNLSNLKYVSKTAAYFWLIFRQNRCFAPGMCSSFIAMSQFLNAYNCINAKICVFLELENKNINVMIIIKTSKVMIKIFLMNINGASLLGDNKTYVIPKKTERISIHVSTVFVWMHQGSNLIFYLKFIQACISQPKKNGFSKIIFQLRFYL